MQCVDCGQEVDLDQAVPLHTGGDKYENTFPCKGCGLLHWVEGAKARKRLERVQAHWLDGKVVSKPLTD